MNNIYNCPTLIRIDKLVNKQYAELEIAKREALDSLFYSERLTEGQREKFLSLYQTIDRAYEIAFEKAVWLLEDQIRKNDADGTSTILLRDKRIIQIIDEDK